MQYKQNIKPILPTAPTQPTQPTQALLPIQKTQPTQKTLPTLSTIERLRAMQKPEIAKQVETYLADYNDPTQLNSYIDALVNREAVSKEFGDTWGTVSTVSGTVATLALVTSVILGAASWIASAILPDAGAIGVAGTAAAKALSSASAVAAKTAAVAAIPAIPAAAKVTYDYGIKPIVKGKPKEAALNTLMNLGETADFAANPVKGFMLEGPEGFVNATGLSSSGRTNYDYDTGNFVTDMLLELVSDPMNWIDIGGAFIKGGALKATVKPLAKNIVDNTTTAINKILKTIDGLSEISAEGSERIFKKVKKVLTNQASKWLEAYNKAPKLTYNPKKDIVGFFKHMPGVDDATREALVETGRAEIKNALIRAIREEIPNITGKELDVVLKEANKTLLWQQALESSYDLVKNIGFDTLVTDNLKGLTSMLTASDNAQKFMSKRAFMTSGYGAGIMAVKYAVDPLKIWYTNRVQKALTASGLFDSQKGLTNLQNYNEAKAKYTAIGAYGNTYLTDKAGKPLYNLDTFHTFISNQFQRDKQLIRETIQKYPTKSIEQAAALDALFQELYGLDFAAYIATLKQIDTAENGIFKYLVDYAETHYNTLMKQTTGEAVSQGMRTSAQLYAKHTVENLVTQPIAVVETLANLSKAKTPEQLVKTLYTLKLNDYAVTAALINDSQIYDIFVKISDTEGVGAFLDNILNDAAAMAPDVNANIRDCVRIIKEAGITFTNVREFYDNIGKLLLPKIDGVNDADLKRYIIDQIFGFKEDVTTLLANFDSTTMPNLMARLEYFLSTKDKIFKFSEEQAPIIRDQIATAFKGYLEAQEIAGISSIKTTIPQNFTKSVDTLAQLFPDFQQEFTELLNANGRIRYILSKVRDENLAYLTEVYTDADTIFNKFDARELSDMGLALRTVADAENLTLFDLPVDASVKLFQDAQKVGKRLKRAIAAYAQYTQIFGELDKDIINKLYSAIYNNIALPLDEVQQIYKCFKVTNEPAEQLAFLIEFYKAYKSNDKFMAVFGRLIDTTGLSADLANRTNSIVRLIRDSSRIEKTDFAWDAMAQSAYYAERQLNEKVLHLVGVYDDLTTLSRKAVKDFNSVIQYLSTSGADNPKVLQLERLSHAAKRVISTLDWFTEKYNSLFDAELATKTIASLHETFSHYPDLYSRYKQTIDDLDAYWRGELKFRQDPKYVENAVDEFTPFWERVKDMNRSYVELQRDKYTENLIYKEITEFYEPSESKIIKKELQQFFIKNPDKKDNILRILNDHNALQTEADWEAYREFIELINLDFDVSDITDADALSFIIVPNALRNDLFNFILETYHINDVRLVYELLDSTYAFTMSNLNKPNIFLNAQRLKDGAWLKAAVHHEAIHNITQRVLNVAERKELHNKVLKSILQMPENLQKVFLEHIFNRQAYNLGYENVLPFIKDGITSLEIIEKLPEEVRERLLDEFLAYAIGNDISSDIFQKQFKVQFTSEQQKIYQETVLKIREELQQVARERIPYKERNTLERVLSNPDIKDTKIVTPWDPIREQQKINQAITKASDANAKASLYNLFNFTPEQFTQELAFRHRFVTFSESDISDPALKSLYLRLLNNLDSNKVHHIYDATKQRHWFVLDKKQAVQITGREVYLNGEHLLRQYKPRRFNEFEIVDKMLGADTEHNLTDMFNGLSADLESITGSPLGDSQGEFLSKETLEKVYTEMPDEVKNLIDTDEWLSAPNFEAYNFNESILGTASSKAKLAMVSPNMIVNAQNALTQAMGYIKAKTEYVHTVFDSAFSIAGENSIYKDFTDKELLDALQNTNEYKLIALVDDKKYGVKVREIVPINENSIKKARELNAVIVPLQTYKDMYKVVNHRLGSAGAAKIWNRILYVYKFGYLLKPGAWIRNWFDTNFKTNLELDTDSRAYKQQAAAYLREIDDINDFIAKRNADGVIKREAIEEYFKLARPNSRLTLETYNEIMNVYRPQGILGNIMSDVAQDGTDVWNTFTHYSGKIIDTVNKTEEINRLALLLAKLDQGETATSALAQLAKTHFDYSFKTTTEQLLEMVFPFSTFTLRNLSYWVEALEKHPWLLRNYTHFMKPHWDFKDYTPEQLATNYQVQNQIINGQLKLGEFNDKVLLFKLNPSINDAIQMFSNPINNIYEKLAAPIKAPISWLSGEYYNYSNLIPGVGPMIQSGQQIISKGTPLPSIATTMNKPRTRSSGNVNYTNRNLQGINGYRDKHYKRPTYTKNVVYDSYAVNGIRNYRTRFYPIVDIAHEIKSRYTTNVSNRVKNRVKVDVFKGIQYRIRLDTNRFRT